MEEASAIRNVGENMSIRTVHSKHFKSGAPDDKIALHFRSFLVCAIIGLAGPGKVRKVGQGLKRDVCAYEKDACIPSCLDQVHVSETRLGDPDAVLCVLILSEVQIPWLFQSTGQLLAPT